MTVPLGVLKAGAIEFDPPLPAAHVEAIDARRLRRAREGRARVRARGVAGRRPADPHHDRRLAATGVAGDPRPLHLVRRARRRRHGHRRAWSRARGDARSGACRRAARHDLRASAGPTPPTRSRTPRRAGRPTRSCSAATPTSRRAPTRRSMRPTWPRSRRPTAACSSPASTPASAARRPSTRRGSPASARRPGCCSAVT